MAAVDKVEADERPSGTPIGGDTGADANPGKHLATRAETSRINERPDAK